MMYWKEIPVQVQGEDQSGKVTRQLSPRFQEAVDTVAMSDGSYGTDDYLDGWQLGSPSESDLPLQDAIDALAEQLENLPEDLAHRILNAQRKGTRNPSPGSTESWER